MTTYISPLTYIAICNYVEQNNLIEALYNKNIIDSSDTYLPYYDDEDAEDNEYGDFDTWITFSGIEKIVDFDILIEKGIPHINCAYGVWIGLSDTNSMDNFVKRVIEMIYDYEVTDEELKNLKDNMDIKIER
jgi:hypothetical protein